ncbi:J domain-containing protein [Nocardioides sp.]|uniref:J domain-containing protein n=1 Tax=Nocardioides sp. TaxID=35761 RepID=UPI0027347530|nr:J domain-containing protein [Nocardioides sp.]MDP3891022.1 J domain-containing protein [Nocardioides sp.]
MNPFTTLGLAETATPGEVKKAYRKRLLQVHPDVIGEAGHQVTVDVIAAYNQALVVAQANAATVEPAPVVGFVPAHHPAHDAGIRKNSAFVASTFRAVA